MAEPVSRHDVVVVGGGIVGMSVALELLARNRTVMVVDRNRPRERASFGNAGVIARTSIVPLASPMIWPNLVRYANNADNSLRIRRRALPGLGRWLTGFLSNCHEVALRRTAQALNPLVGAALEHHRRHANWTGSRGLIKTNGFLKLYRTASSFASAALELAVLREAGAKVTVLSNHEVADLEPSLTRAYHSGVFSPDSGSVERPWLLVDAYHNAFLDRGGTFIEGDARQFSLREDGVEIGTDRETVSGRNVVIAAGAWSSELTALLGCKAPLAADRGYHTRFALKTGARIQRPIIDTGAGYSLAPEGETVRIMTGVELAGVTDPPDTTQLARAVEEARASVSLSHPVSEEIWMAPRPSTPDGLPVIGRYSRDPRVLFAFGHGHIGFSTGPVTGRIVADLISGVNPPCPIAPFSADRFT